MLAAGGQPVGGPQGCQLLRSCACRRALSFAFSFPRRGWCSGCDREKIPCSPLSHTASSFLLLLFALSQAEKNELRDEKARLKAEKERLEQQVKSMAYPSAGYVPNPHAAAMQAAAAAFAAQAQTQATIPAKLAAPAPVPQVAMWQWLPPASVDTSQDHVLRPPVA